MSILSSPAVKKDILDIYETLCKMLLYPRLMQPDISAVQNWLGKMRDNPNQMETRFGLDTTGGVTKITIESWFIQGGKQ